MWKKIGEFDVVSDYGEIFPVYEYQEFIESGHDQESRPLIPGMIELQTPDGKLVQDKGNGIYEIDVLGLRLRRIVNP